MANLNKVMLIGRLTRDPEMRTFSNGGKVASFGFAVNNRRKNNSTGQWEDEPVFIDVKAFNRETGRKLADQVEQYLNKGRQVYIEGHLVFEQWDDKETGKKRSVLKVVADDFQFLDSRTDREGGAGEGGMASPRTTTPARNPQAQPAQRRDFEEPPPPDTLSMPEPPREEEIPF